MKRVLSSLLCLLMCISIFSTTAAEVKALEPAEFITVQSSGFSNDRVAYTLSLAPNQKKIKGAIIKVEFDENVLEVSDLSGAAGRIVDGEYVLNVNGFYEKGLTYDDDGVYSFAYMNPNGFSTGEDAVEFLSIILTSVGDKRPQTDVKIYCEEYITDDAAEGEADTNDITKDNLAVVLTEDSVFTLGAAVNKQVTSTENGLKFTWTGVVGADYYDIYRKDADNDWALLASVAGDITSYEDIGAKGKEYYYSVATRNEYGVRDYDKTGLPGFNFGTITEQTVSGITETGLVVSWGALDGAEKYEVFRKTDDDTDWLKIGTTEKTSYESTNLISGTTYYYTVKAIKGKYFAEASVEPASGMFIAVPEIAYVQVNYSDIVINWPVVKGASGYKVFRKGSADADYVDLGEIVGNAYEDADVKDGETYSYKIQAVGENINSVIPVKGYSVVKLPITKSVVASLGIEKITISWEKVDLAESYIVYRNSQPIAEVSADKCKFDDTTVKSGFEYSYSIATKAGDIVTAQSTATEPMYYLDAPVIDCIVNGSEGMEVVFNAVNGAEKYIIYRRTPGASFVQIGELQASSNNVYVDTTAESGVQYIYGVCSVSGETTSPLCESNVACRLAEPKISKFTSEYKGVTLKWGAVNGAEQYIVWYRAPGREWEAIKTVSSSTLSYTHTGALSGRNNFYAIQAICGESVSTITEEYFYYLAAPKIDFIGAGTSQVTLRWDEVGGAESYRIYRRLKGETKYVKLADTESLSYKDTKVVSGKDYEYTIKAYDGDEWSSYNKTGWKIRFLSTPKLTSAKSANGGLQVKWEKVKGASKYVVYRKKKGEDEFTKIKTVTTNSYLDKTAKSNTTYYYTVKAYCDGSYSYYNTKGIACKYIATPVVKAAVATSGIKVSWNKVAGAKQYIVYRKAGNAKSWTKYKTVSSSTLSFVDKSVKNKTKYTYTVKACKDSLVSGYNTSGVKAVFVTAPKTATATSGKSGITVKWSKVSGVSGYIIYRKAGSGSYAKLATVSGSTKVSYVDKKAKKGTTYTYYVQAYYSSYKSAPRYTAAVKDKY